MFVRNAFLADTVSLDATGKLNAIGIFEIVLSPKFPTIHRDMTLVIQLEGTATEQGSHKLSVELRDDDANKLASFEQTIVLKKPTASQGIVRTGVVTKLQDLPFRRAGQYEFVIFVDDRFLGRVPFTAQEIGIQKTGEA